MENLEDEEESDETTLLVAEKLRMDKAIDEALDNLLLYGICLQYESLFVKTPCRTSIRTGHLFINEILDGHDKRCYENFRMHKEVFRMLCDDLSNHFGLKTTRELTIHESVGMFLFTIAHGVGNRVVQETFQHSGETVHSHFHKVLNAVVRMSKILIQPACNYNEVCPPSIRHNDRFFPYFKDCIGAIDGTHIKATVPARSESVKYYGRKGIPTQNVMAVCDFDMCFTFVMAGWEGSAHDCRVFYDATEDATSGFPHPIGDKFYLVDAGYPNKRGYLAPFKGDDVRYHIQQFRQCQGSNSRQPRNVKEKFNYLHSSLRNVIERTFGVWKSRFFILKDFHANFSMETQVKVIIATMAIHNYIRQKGKDSAFSVAEEETYEPRSFGGLADSNVASQAFHRQTTNSRSTQEDTQYMKEVRQAIAEQLFTTS